MTIDHRHISWSALLGSLALLGFGVGRGASLVVDIALVLVCLVALSAVFWSKHHDLLSAAARSLQSARGATGFAWRTLMAISPDRYIAWFAIGGSLVLLGYGVGRGTPIAVGLALMLACLIAIPCALWLQFHDRLSTKARFDWPHNGTLGLSTVNFVLLGVTFLVFAFRTDPYQRPAAFFVLLTLIVGITALAGLSTSSKQQEYLVLFQIIVIGVVLAWSGNLLYPDVVGSDPWYHRALANGLATNGNFDSTPELTAYVKLPIFHLIVASFSVLTGLEYRDAAMGSVSLLQVVCTVLFTYLFATLLAPKSPAVRMLAPLVMVITPLFVHLGSVSIPNGFATVLLMPVLYLIYTTIHHDTAVSASGGGIRGFLQWRRIEAPGTIQYQSGRVYYLVLLFLVTLILTHTITGFFMATVLFVAWFVFRLNPVSYPRRSEFPLLLPVGYLVALLAWWSTDAESLRTLTQVLGNKFGIDSFLPAWYAEITPFTPLGLEEQLIGYFTQFGFLVLPLLGLLYMVSRRGTRLTFNYAVIGITPIALVVISKLLNISLIQDRWFFFSAVLNAIALALTCLLIRPAVQDGDAARSRAPQVIPVLLICLLAFVAITDPSSNQDNRLLVPDAAPRTAWTESELTAISTTNDVYNRVVATDWNFAETQKWNGLQPTDYSIEIYRRDLSLLDENFILVRKDTVAPPLYLFSFTVLPFYDLYGALQESGFSEVYDSGSTRGYLKY